MITFYRLLCGIRVNDDGFFSFCFLVARHLHHQRHGAVVQSHEFRVCRFRYLIDSTVFATAYQFHDSLTWANHIDIRERCICNYKRKTVWRINALENASIDAAWHYLFSHQNIPFRRLNCTESRSADSPIERHAHYRRLHSPSADRWILHLCIPTVLQSIDSICVPATEKWIGDVNAACCDGRKTRFVFSIYPHMMHAIASQWWHHKHLGESWPSGGLFIFIFDRPFHVFDELAFGTCPW